MSDWELWGGKIGKLRGRIKIGAKVSTRIKEQNFGIVGLFKRICKKNLEILSIEEVDIEKMIKDEYIAGLDQPIIPPYDLN
ncbi:MAG: hypothetical protein WC812_01360 [Candidatus Pacearchaeota archaeon]|jgi:hypothetical protein